MKNQSQGGEAIRLTNKTARALREQAKQQRLALYVAASVITVVLALFAMVMGMQRLVYVPVTMLVIILLDALIILLARGRYLSLTGQAICTEAAARQMRGESAEEFRVKTARRDLEKIKADLAASFEEDEEDEDFSLPLPSRKMAEKPAVTIHESVQPQEEEAPTPDNTLVMEPVAQRRRRQARLQVLSSEQAK